MTAYLITALVMFVLGTIIRLRQLSTGKIAQTTPGGLALAQFVSTGFAAWAAYLLFVGA
jgi:hypothetical protein